MKGACPQQFFNLGFRNGRNVMAPLLDEVCDLLALDHATVADEGDLGDAKPGLDLVDLRSKGVRIWRIAGKDFDGDRWPASSQRRPMTIRILPFLPSRL